MRITGERRRHGGSTSSAARPGRLSKVQELILFVVLLAVLIALIVWGMQA
jgi:hypothetical protein